MEGAREIKRSRSKMAARYVLYPYVIKAEMYYDALMQTYQDQLHYDLRQHQPKPLDYSQLTSFLDFDNPFLSPWHRDPPPPPPPPSDDDGSTSSNDGEQPINNIQSTSFFSHEVFDMKPEDPDAILFIACDQTSKLCTINVDENKQRCTYCTGSRSL